MSSNCDMLFLKKICIQEFYEYIYLYTLYVFMYTKDYESFSFLILHPFHVSSHFVKTWIRSYGSHHRCSHTFRSRIKSSFHSFYLLTPFGLWKISLTRNNSYSSKFEILSLEMRRSLYVPFKQFSGMLHLVRYQYFLIRSWIRDTSIAIQTIRFEFLQHFNQIVSMFVWFLSLVRLLAVCQYLLKKI